jgi:hypothetical protein
VYSNGIKYIFRSTPENSMHQETYDEPNIVTSQQHTPVDTHSSNDLQTVPVASPFMKSVSLTNVKLLFFLQVY